MTLSSAARRVIPSPHSMRSATRRTRAFPSGWLSTLNGDIVDSSGNSFALAGLNDNKFDQGTGGIDPPATDFAGQKWAEPPTGMYAAMRGWGFNFMRLCASWAHLEPTAPVPDGNGGWTHTWNAAYLAAMDDIVARAKAANVGILMDLHQSFWCSSFLYIQKGSSILKHGEAGPPDWYFPNANLTSRLIGDPNLSASNQIYGSRTLHDSTQNFNSSLGGKYIGTPHGGATVDRVCSGTYLTVKYPGWQPGSSSTLFSSIQTETIPPNGDPYVISEDYRTAKSNFIANVQEPGVAITPWQGLADAFQMLASRYANEPTVFGYDLFNEPLPQKNVSIAVLNANLRPMYNAVIAAIRAVNSNALIIVEDNDYTSWNNQGQVLALDAAPTDSAPNKLVYSTHIYPVDWASALTFMDLVVARAASWGLPMLVGELDLFEYMRSIGTPGYPPTPPSNANWLADAWSMFNYFALHRIHWCAWADDGSIGLVWPRGSLTPKPDALAALRFGM